MDKTLYQFSVELIQQSRYLIAITGAGISTESGIPAFRGTNGLWSRFDPEVYASRSGFLSNPQKAWELFLHLYESLVDARANAGHIALAKMEKRGKLQCTITQNIDGLHQKAGQENVIELHGSLRNLICTVCSQTFNIKGLLLDSQDLPPVCNCGGVLKPDAVLFEESIPAESYFAALKHIRMSDVVLLIGTSGLVHPVNELPEMAVNHGASLIEINIEPTVLTAVCKTVFLKGRAADILDRFNCDLF